MKKSIKTLALSFLTIGMLAGCNQSPAAPDWSAEAKALMDEYAYGIYIPYFNKEGLNIAFDTELGRLVFDGVKVEGTELRDYNAKFSEDDGWEKVTGDYVDITKIPAGSFTAYSKGKQTDAGMRYIDVLVYATETTGEGEEATTSYATTGDFTIEVYDPYIYDLEAVVDELFEYYDELPAWDIPLPASTSGAFYFQEDSYNELYYVFGAYSYMNVTILGYHITSAEFATFEANFANWEKTVAQGVTSASLLIPETGVANVSYMYDATEQKLGYIVYLGLGALPLERYTEWPADVISAAFEDNDAEEFPFPAFAGANLEFTVQDYPGNGVEIGVYGATAAEVSTYIGTTLPGAEWTVTYDEEEATGSAKKVFEDLNGVAKITIYDEGEDGFFLDVFYKLDPIPGTVWPAEEISAAFKALGLKEFPIPYPTGEGLSFEYEFDEENIEYVDYPNWCYDKVKISGLTQDGVDAYIKQFEDAGWEAVEDAYHDIDFYKHFEDLGLTAHVYFERYYFANYGYINIKIYYVSDLDPLPVWPTEDIAAILGEDVTDVLPALTGFDGATFKAYSDGYGMGVLAFVGEENQDAAITAYAGILAEAGFIPADESNTSFASPNGQFFVSISKGTDGAIDIALSLPRNLAKEIVNQMEKEGVTDWTCPDFSSLEDKINLTYTGSYEGWAYQLVFDGDVVTAFTTILATDGYSVPETPTKYGYECVSADEQVEIDVLYDSESDLTIVMFYATADIW